MENLTTPSRKPPVFRRPAIVLDGSEKHSDSSSSDAPDGAHFRKPLGPVQMTISPGNAANETKLAEKLKKLELSRKKTIRSHPIDLKTPSKVDLVATERFFVESSVENIAQTPRNQSIREPFRTPARFTAQDVSSMDFPSQRDSMRSNATYVLTTPRLDRALHPHNDPFTPALTTPSRKPTTVATPLAYEEKLERQFVALSSWANVILDSASFVSEIDLGTSKQDASRKLQEMLTKPPKKSGGTNEGTKRRYTDLCLRKKCLDYLKRADSVYQSTPIPGQLKAMVERGEIGIKQNIEVYANIGVQTSILSLLFSLHPFWLFIGVETVCAEFSDHDTVSLDARLPFSSSSFAPATVRFIHDHMLANAKLMAKKKFAIGTVKKIVTDKGREMLHKHFITCMLNMAVLLEYGKNSYLFENTPGLFVKNSEIKTVSDFCTELSRLVLSASGTPLNKAFDKTSFRRTYRQSFLEEYQYVMKSVRDMADGIILGRLIELLTDSSPLAIIGNMRNPQGDRLRKKGNVEKALSAAAEAGIDVDGISIEQILGAHRESCLDLMWRLVGVYVKKKAEQEPLRRESLCLEGSTDVEDADEMTVMGAPLGGMAESAFSVYQQLASHFGLHLSKWADLEDGLLLSSMWQYYNPAAPDVRFYGGDSLFDKVASAAESDLGIPLALTALRDERQLGLFAHMFLSRLISYKRLRDSEMSDAESDASSIVSIIRKEGVNLSEETERIQRVRLESEHAISAREEEERLKREEERRREEELRRRFEEEEEERLTSEWRSPSRGSASTEIEEKMLMEKGEEERIEEEMKKAQMQREEEARIEEERVRREEDERLAEEQRLREEEERRRMEEEERIRKEREEEEERFRKEEEARLEAERLEEEERLAEEQRLRDEEERRRKEEEERERVRKEEEEERIRKEEEARLEAERIKREEEERLAEEQRLREEEERRRKEEEERIRKEEEARLEAERVKREEEERLAEEQKLREQERRRMEEEERIRREEEARLEEERRRLEEEEWMRVRMIEEARLQREEEERLRVEEGRQRAARTIQRWYSSVLTIRAARALLQQLREERWRREEEARIEAERVKREEEERLADEQRLREEEERRRMEEEERIRKEREEEEERLRKEEEARLEAERLAEEQRLREEEERRRMEEEEAERVRRAKEEEERARREEEARIEAERLKREEEERLAEEQRLREEEERRRMEEEERIRKEEEERLERERLRREEEEILRREEEERQRWEEEARIETERKRIAEEERQRMVEEERLMREERARLERERLMREEEERKKREEEERLAREEEARLEMARLHREEEERRLRDEEEARLEMERQWEEEQERLRREEEERLERERVWKEQEELRRRHEEEEEERAAKQRQAHEKEERMYQEMVAAQELNKKLAIVRENRAARVIQSAIRSWLHKKRVERRTMELLQRMDGTPRNERSGRMTISGMECFSEDRLLAGVREIKRRQRKLSLTLYHMTNMTRLSRAEAATRIQAAWRGVLARRKHRVEIELIGVRMREFNEKADKIMEGNSEERAVPVSKRLERARNCLQNPLRLYDIKVACYTTMSLCRLSSLYCERAIVLGLPSLLIECFDKQADRSPAFEEIIEFGVQALEEMVKCPTPRVRVEMIAEGANVVKIAAHQMLAFHHNKVIAPAAIRILRKCKEILPVETHAVTFEKMPTYYLKKGEDKFGKLPSTDVRHKEFVELQKAFSN